MTDPTPGVGLVLDCSDPGRLAEFWAPPRLGEPRDCPPQRPAGARRKPGPKLLLQQVPDAKTVKNRTHLDVETVDIEAAATRLEARGARRVRDDHIDEHGSTWILMTDPEGNDFCVCDGGTMTGD